jgi:hypothetical protein
LIGTVAGFNSEWWPVFDRIAGRLHIGIRNHVYGEAVEQLEILARQFREAIERTPRNQLPLGLQNFPVGACGDATLLLGHYLKAQGFGYFDYVSGTRGEGDDWHSHAWLRREDVIIDITADQFPEIDQAVIVATGSPWHGEFESEVLNEADFVVYDPHTAATLGAAYRVVLQNMAAAA